MTDNEMKELKKLMDSLEQTLGALKKGKAECLHSGSALIDNISKFTGALELAKFKLAEYASDTIYINTIGSMSDLMATAVTYLLALYVEDYNGAEKLLEKLKEKSIPNLFEFMKSCEKGIKKANEEESE